MTPRIPAMNRRDPLAHVRIAAGHDPSKGDGTLAIYCDRCGDVLRTIWEGDEQPTILQLMTLGELHGQKHHD